MPQALADVAERTVATYLQPLPGLNGSFQYDGHGVPSASQSAAVSTMPAALSSLKATLGTALGRPGTAPWLPVRRDPATAKH